jgi:hypothetical protein
MPFTSARPVRRGGLFHVAERTTAPLAPSTIVLLERAPCYGGAQMPELPAVTYMETLPEGCPPQTAQPPEQGELLRLVSCEAPTIQDFLSHAAKGIPIRGDVDACRWASCSMFVPPGDTRLIKLPRLKRMPFVARVAVHGQCGTCIANVQNGHVDLWFFRSFDPVGAVRAVSAREHYE